MIVLRMALCLFPLPYFCILCGVLSYNWRRWGFVFSFRRNTRFFVPCVGLPSVGSFGAFFLAPEMAILNSRTAQAPHLLQFTGEGRYRRLVWEGLSPAT